MHTPPDPMRLTASLVSQFFRHRCDRQLRFDLVPPADRGPGIPRPNRDPKQGPIVGPRPGAGLLTAAGRAWERRKLRQLRARFGEERVLAAGWSERGDPVRFPAEEVAAVLRRPGAAEFLVQPELRLADAAAFAARAGWNPAHVALASAQPDLIRIRRSRDGAFRFQVIDIKASRQPSVGHFAQVAFYTLLLEEVCRQGEIPGVVDARWGFLWSRAARGPRRFELGAYRFHVERFLREDVPRVASAAPEQAAWHLAPRCAGCVYLEHCRADAERTDHLSRIPGLSPLARETLEARGIRSVRDLSRSLRKDTYTGCHALESGAPRIRHRAEALVWKKSVDVEGATHLMGPREDVRILLSAEGDPVSGICFALGVRIEEGGAAPRAEVFIAEAGKRSAERRIVRELLRRVYDLLRESGNGRTLHAFVYDRTELELLRGALHRHLNDPEMQEGIARVLRVLAPRSAVPNPQMAQSAPGTVLLDAVSALYALPIPFAYDLAAVSAALRPSADPHLHRPRPDYSWPLGSQVAFERIHNVWRGRPHRTRAGEESPDEVRERIRATVLSKLAAIDSVVRATRERAGKRGRAAETLQMQSGTLAPEAEPPIADPLLEELRIFSELESAAEATSIRALHALPAEQRAARFECIRGMEWVETRPDGALVFEFDPECRDAKFRPGDFTLVLTNEGTDGLRQTDRDPWKRRKLGVELLEYQLSHSPPRVVLAPSGGFAKAREQGMIHLDRRCVLDRAPADFSTARVVSTLRALAEGHGEAGGVLDLLRGDTPPGWRPPFTGADEVWEEVRVRATLNVDQERAWRAAFERPLCLVWGPPGTGKTYLLGWILIGLAEAARRAGRPCRILVSAATHRAIANVLARVAKEIEVAGWKSPPRLVKLRGSGSESDAELQELGVEILPDRELPRILEAADGGGEALVVGSTVWSLWKQMRSGDPDGVPIRPWFDVVVIDEASQIRVAEALIALSGLGVGGQAILCGDDRQLAPVIRGRYDADSGARFGSAFDVFAGNHPRLTLRESRRMNGVLVEYPRDLFYPGLFSVCPERRIALLPEVPDDPTDALFRDLFLRPGDAVVLCTYRGFGATARNPFEARCVARIARLARQLLRDPDTGAPYTDARFASHALAVISPHRAQNSAILAELLASGFAPGALPVVDTVERMQGNERETILVSYAVADREYAEREAEFLLNPNRFNVSITRPRAKLIVFLSEAILDVIPDEERVMTGSMAIKRYAEHCADAEREVELPGPDGTPVAVRLRYRRLAETAS